MKNLLSKTSAWLPVTMSVTALIWTVGYIVVVGINQVKVAQDEGIGARVFQLLMGAQLPIILFFLLKWLPQKSKQALMVLVLQVLAIIIAFTPVYFLEL
jgi:asparagine N-glycosylation enzyme membrane subunit Stt3